MALLRALEHEGHRLTRSQLHGAFDAGRVVSGGHPLKPGRRVESPVEVEVVLPQRAPLRVEAEDIPIVVVHEDEAVLVVDKPANMVVHQGAGHAHGTLVSAVLHHLGEGAALPVLAGNEATRPGIVHRLDKGTSGLLVIAKTAAAQDVLAEQFRTRTITRSYVAIVHGRPEFSEHRMETGHGRDPRNRMRFAPWGPRRAVTRFQVEGANDRAAMLRCVLETGRTHQIRMHAAFLGHPVVGDVVYGGSVPEGCVLEERHALHAAVLGFRHPSGESLYFTSALPQELVLLARTLGLEANA